MTTDEYLNQRARTVTEILDKIDKIQNALSEIVRVSCEEHYATTVAIMELKKQIEDMKK